MKEQSPLTPRYEVVEQLKSARKAQNVTQEVLADQIDVIRTNRNRYGQARRTIDQLDTSFRRRLILSNY